MKKIFFFLAIISMTLLGAGQSKSLFSDRLTYSVGIENHLPVNTFRNIYSYGVGVSPAVHYSISKKFVLNFNPSFVVYFYSLKSVGVSGSTGYVSLMGGVRYFFIDKVYIIGQSGLGIKTSKFGKETAFAISGGAGIILKKRFDVQLKYFNIQTSTLSPKAVGLRFAYIFGK